MNRFIEKSERNGERTELIEILVEEEKKRLEEMRCWPSGEEIGQKTKSKEKINR